MSVNLREMACKVFRWLRFGLVAAIIAISILSAGVVEAGGGKPATKLVCVADTRDMAPGYSKFVADMYNDSLPLFGLFVVVQMATMGAILGFGLDKLVALLGINLGKLDHHE